MKNVLLFVVLCLAVNIKAQNMPCTEIPYIEVTGSADIEIEPDEIRLTVVISGYEKGITKQEVTLEEVDKNLLSILSGAGISKSKIILKNASTQGYWYYWWRADQDNDARVTKEYEVVFTNYQNLNKVLAQLPGPKDGFLNVNISNLKNKDIAKYRKQTKIEAIKAAKAKAQYLLESVGSAPGKLIQVIELDEDDFGWYRPAYANSNTISQVSLNAGNGSNGGDDTSMQKIKLRYRIKARFEIQ